MIRLLVLSAVILAVHAQIINDIWIYNGHLHGIDDIHQPHYHDLRSGLSIGGVGGVGGLGGIGGLGGRRRGGIRIGGYTGLRSCNLGCTLQFIQPQCRYIPVIRDVIGYCRGCPEDICMGGRQGRRVNRRMRRIRRLICRATGSCFGDALGPVGGFGGVGGLGGLGGVGGLGRVGGLVD